MSMCSVKTRSQLRYDYDITGIRRKTNLLHDYTAVTFSVKLSIVREHHSHSLLKTVINREFQHSLVLFINLSSRFIGPGMSPTRRRRRSCCRRSCCYLGSCCYQIFKVLKLFSLFNRS